MMKLLSMLNHSTPTVRQVLLSLWAILVSTLILPWASAGTPPHVHDQTILVVTDFNVDSRTLMLPRDGPSGEGTIWYLDRKSLSIPSLRLSLPAPWEIAGFGDFNGDGSPEILYRNSICGTTALWTFDGIPLSTDSLVFSPGSLYLDELSDSIGDAEWDTIWCHFPISSDHHPRLIPIPIDNSTISRIQIRAPPKINI